MKHIYHGYILNTLQKMKLLKVGITSESEAIEGFIDSKNEAINFKK